ncbi:MAG: chloride channel protein [Terriglobia bacterium]
MREGKPRLLLESAFLGVAGGLAARLFMALLGGCQHLLLFELARYRAPGMTESGRAYGEIIGHFGLWLIPAVTTLGGVLSGLIVYRFAPEAEGHGTDTAVNAFHRKEGLIRDRVPLVKMIASAITIGSGGSAGREGPIALITAGLGSIYARLTHRSEEERRILLLAGMAAGLSAIFRTPLGTSVFAIEVLYGHMEFEVGALFYTMFSSAVAYAVDAYFTGFGPLFRVPAIPPPALSDYTAYVFLGLAAGLIATALPLILYRVRDLFRVLPAPVWTKPAIGGLGVGLIALALPQVLGGGYGWIQQAINGELPLFLALALLFAKMIAFPLTVSSGGSGGVFAPSLFVGAMLGAVFATVLHQLPAVFVVVGMASVFGAAARVPIATMLMVTEMAGGYQLLVPAGMAVMISYLVQVRLSSFVKYRSLYEGQVPTRHDSPAHYFEQIRVGLDILGGGNLPPMDKIGHLDLPRLLRARVRLDLLGGKELAMGVIREGSPLVGKAMGMLHKQLSYHEFQIITIMRRGQVLLPRPEMLLEADDQVLLVASPDGKEPLSKYLELIPELRAGGMQAPRD